MIARGETCTRTGRVSFTGSPHRNPNPARLLLPPRERLLIEPPAAVTSQQCRGLFFRRCQQGNGLHSPHAVSSWSAPFAYTAGRRPRPGTVVRMMCRSSNFLSTRNNRNLFGSGWPCACNAERTWTRPNCPGKSRTIPLTSRYRLVPRDAAGFGAAPSSDEDVIQSIERMRSSRNSAAFLTDFSYSSWARFSICARVSMVDFLMARASLPSPPLIRKRTDTENCSELDFSTTHCGLEAQ